MNKSALLIGLVALIVIAVVVYFFNKAPKLEGFSALSRQHRLGAATPGCQCGWSTGNYYCSGQELQNYGGSCTSCCGAHKLSAGSR